MVSLFQAVYIDYFLFYILRCEFFFTDTLVKPVRYSLRTNIRAIV